MISTTRPRSQSCSTFSGIQSATRIHGNTLLQGWAWDVPRVPGNLSPRDTSPRECQSRDVPANRVPVPSVPEPSIPVPVPGTARNSTQFNSRYAFIRGRRSGTRGPKLYSIFVRLIRPIFFYLFRTTSRYFGSRWTIGHNEDKEISQLSL